MKIRMFFFLAALVCGSAVTAQIIRKSNAPGKTAAPVAAPAPVYRLTAAKVSIRTGADNKEFPSVVDLSLTANGGNTKGIFLAQRLRNEMKSNSTAEFGLSQGSMGGVSHDLLLTELQTYGLRFKIEYSANFQFDAWKIEGVTLTLEFRDQQNNLHPSLAQKVISFGNANGFLNGYFERSMVCTTDGFFNPLSAEVITGK